MPDTLPPWQVDNVDIRYGSVVALRSVSVSLAPGRILGLLGANGAGKTTLLEASVGLRSLSHGQIHVLGESVRSLSSETRARLGIALQDWGIAPWTRVDHALQDRARLYRTPAPVADLLDGLALGEVAARPIRRLSGGQQRRVATALALIGRPDLAFLDEPASGLDPHARIHVRDLLRSCADGGMSIVLSSHVGEDLEAICDDIAVLHHGRLLLHAPLADVIGPRECVTFSAAAHASLQPLQSALAPTVTVEVIAPGRFQVTPHNGHVDPQILSAITSWASAHGHPVRDMRIGSPSLTDRYLALTGSETT